MANSHIKVVWVVTKCYSTEVSLIESSFSIAPLSKPKVGADWKRIRQAKEEENEHAQYPSAGLNVGFDYRDADSPSFSLLFTDEGRTTLLSF